MDDVCANKYLLSLEQHDLFSKGCCCWTTTDLNKWKYCYSFMYQAQHLWYKWLIYAQINICTRLSNMAFSPRIAVDIRIFQFAFYFVILYNPWNRPSKLIIEVPFTLYSADFNEVLDGINQLFFPPSHGTCLSCFGCIQFMLVQICHVT